jgi:hypothetical protein
LVIRREAKHFMICRKGDQTQSLLKLI